MSQFTILVADNLESARESYERRLIKRGYEVQLAGSPEEAEELLREHLIHLALIDVRLEKDANENDRSGLELCKRMDPIVPRILISGFTDWTVIREALRPYPLGERKRLADGFFFKGFGESGHEDVWLYQEIARILKEEYEFVPKDRIAVLTSGGDSPGMNAAIWSVVRTAIRNHTEVLGVLDGYHGLIKGNMRKLRWNDVSDIMIESGTVLGSARCDEFYEARQRESAVEHILNKHVSGLVVIGGDGSMNGAKALAEDVSRKHRRLKTVALPGTIDNDLAGTDISLGSASAANAMVNQVRQLVKPAKALHMIFIVEVMGALSGYLALQTAIGSGADGVLLPERIVSIEPGDGPPKNRVNYGATKVNLNRCLSEIAEQLRLAFDSGKQYGFIIQAEGIDKVTSTYVETQVPQPKSHVVADDTTIERLNANYSRKFIEASVAEWNVERRPKIRAQELGHAVRGVLPSRFDIWLGAVLGAEAVKQLIEGKSEVMIGWTDNHLVQMSFEEVVTLSNKSPSETWAVRASWQELNNLHENLSYRGEPRADTIDESN